MTRPTIKTSSETKQRLEAYRDRDDHTSFDSALRALLTTAETPLPTNGIANDAVPTDALRVAEYFNIADRTYPLPRVIGTALDGLDHTTADSDYSQTPRLNHKFRLFMAGHWFFDTDAYRHGLSAVPHVDAYTIDGDGWLFKLRTTTNSMLQNVGGLPDGEFWFVLAEDADYEEAVLAITQTDAVEFLAPAGGVPEKDEPGSLPPFGGYDSYWVDPDGKAGRVKRAEAFHGLRTLPEFIAQEGVALFAQQLNHKFRLQLDRRQHARETIDDILADAIDSVDDADVAAELDAVTIEPDAQSDWGVDWDAVTADLSDAATAALDDARIGHPIPGGKIDTNAVAVPVSMAARLHVVTETMTVSTEDGDQTVEELVESNADQLVQLSFFPVVPTPMTVLEAVHETNWDSNPHELSFDEYIDEYCAALDVSTTDLDTAELDDVVAAIRRLGVDFPDADAYTADLYYPTVKAVATSVTESLISLVDADDSAPTAE